MASAGLIAAASRLADHLRVADADAFVEYYDQLLSDGLSEEELDWVKERARILSEDPAFLESGRNAEPVFEQQGSELGKSLFGESEIQIGQSRAESEVREKSRECECVGAVEKNPTFLFHEQVCRIIQADEGIDGLRFSEIHGKNMGVYQSTRNALATRWMSALLNPNAVVFPLDES